jgi:hypothetical protein
VSCRWVCSDRVTIRDGGGGSKIDDNAGIGIRINGDEPSAILNSEVSRNGDAGIITLSGPTIVVNSEISDNALTGIALSVVGR